MKKFKVMEGIKEVFRCFTEFIEKPAHFFAGLIASICGYFLPVRDITFLIILFFILDVIFGFWAARKLRSERFSVKIIWDHTMPRMLISVVLVLGAFMWDEVFNQTAIQTYKVIGWFISGVLLYSIAENGYQISKWKVFKDVAGLIKRKTRKDVDGPEE